MLLPGGQGLALALQLLIAILAGTTIVLTFDKSLFAWHPSLMTVGAIVFLSEGYLASRHIKTNRRAFFTQLHMLVQLGALVCMLIGFLIVVVDKIREGDEHFEHLHEILGVSSILAIVCQIFLGFRIYMLPHNRFTHQTLQQLAKIHRWLGLGALLSGHLAVILGLLLYFGTSRVGWTLSLLVGFLTFGTAFYKGDRKISITSVNQLDTNEGAVL
jgi:hypothetical protein